MLAGNGKWNGRIDEGRRDLLLQQVKKQIKCEFLGLWKWVHEVQIEKESEPESLK